MYRIAICQVGILIKLSGPDSHGANAEKLAQVFLIAGIAKSVAAGRRKFNSSVATCGGVPLI